MGWEGKLGTGGLGDAISVTVLGLLTLLNVILTWGLLEWNPSLSMEPPLWLSLNLLKRFCRGTNKLLDWLEENWDP